MDCTIEYAQEGDGRRLAEVLQLPNVLTYGAASDDATAKASVIPNPHGYACLWTAMVPGPAVRPTIIARTIGGSFVAEVDRASAERPGPRCPNGITGA
jgi:hypothetical protein